MGWFDESDDDEEEPDKPKINLPSHSDLMGTAKVNDNAADEDDPLDAYMKVIALQQKPSTTATAIETKASQRLDLDNEEEATSHWNNELKPVSILEEGSEDDTDGFLGGQGKQSSQARRALDKRKAWNGDTPPSFPDPLKEPIVYEPFTKAFWSAQNSPAGRKWRQANQVTCSCEIDPIHRFAELRNVFGEPLLQAIVKTGFTAPTTVQSQTLSVAMAGRDALVTASTGQGKTLAFCWPAAVHVANQPALAAHEMGPIALILVPTRELALQVHKQAKPMLNAVGKETKAVIGGQGKYILQQELKRNGGVDLVVATPGRMLDVCSGKKGLSLRRVTFVVLDEADKMLQMGFEVQVRQLLGQIRSDRQTIMLSATMGRRMEKVAKDWLQRDYIRISVGRTGEASQNVEQHVMVLPNEQAKLTFLLEMLPTLMGVGRTIVFVATREGCERLVTRVRERLPDLAVDSLHGDKHQSDRNAALRAFRKGQISVLIATDVAARGLDVPQVATVLNFDPPKNLDSHVHRIGRAGRLQDNAQQKGSAYTLLTPKNADFANVLRGAFEREGRSVSPELAELAQKSRRGGTVADRNTRNTSGMGLDERDASHGERSGTKGTPSDAYYGPSPNDAPPQKRSRWA